DRSVAGARGIAHPAERIVSDPCPRRTGVGQIDIGQCPACVSISPAPARRQDQERRLHPRSATKSQQRWRIPMRVMVIVKANADSEAGVMPSEALLTQMGQFNEQLVKAGILLAGEGLHPSSRGVRVRFSADAAPSVMFGPF